MDIPESLVSQIVEFVKNVPRGKVVSYGQIASQLALRDARVIGWALHAAGNAEGVPWWRVLNNEGRITIKDEALRMQQKELLIAEGIPVNDEFILDIEKYRYGTVPGQKRLL
jgi:methylated-DNA-protein-cysteine methyltransferase-like protein